MKNDSYKNITEEFFLQNMQGKCCIKLIEIEIEKLNCEICEIRPGYLKLKFNTKNISSDIIKKKLKSLGFGITKSREQKIVEQIKIAVYELIHEMNNADSVVRKSEYLVEKLNLNFKYLSKLFSKYEQMTLERYFIVNKIERIKTLILNNEYTLSEIAYMMDYSSVQYLSNQFKKETGISVTEYKKQTGLE